MILYGTFPFKRLFEPAGVVVGDPVVKLSYELRVGDALPVPVGEELVLEPAEESFHCSIVRRIPFRTHAAHEPVVDADFDPARPAVVGAPVRVD